MKKNTLKFEKRKKKTKKNENFSTYLEKQEK